MIEDNSSVKPRKRRRFWPVLLLIFCFAASAVAGSLFASKTIKSLAKSNRNIAEIVEEPELLKVSDKTTVLIMGVDEREDDVGRSDTLIVATIDPKINQAALLSIPRDTRVKVGNRGFDKINAAYAYGGERLAEKTVENFLGIDIDHYVIVNTHAFVDLVDAIGGIDIDVEKRMYYEDPWDDDGGLVIDLYPGFQHLDGADAVTYVRYRDSEGDIGRVKRQQKFIAAVADKLTSPSIIPEIPTLIKETIDAIKTDLSMRQMLELAGSLADAYKNGIEMDMVPGQPIYIDDVSYWIPDVEMVRLSVADALGIEVDPFLRERMRDAASEYQSSIPEHASRADDENPVGRPYSRERTSERRSEERNSDRRSSDRLERNSNDRNERTDSVERLERDSDDRLERLEQNYDRMSERQSEDRNDRYAQDRYDRETERNERSDAGSYSDRSSDRYSDQNIERYSDRYSERYSDLPERTSEERSYDDRSERRNDTRIERIYDGDSEYEEPRPPSPDDYRR